MCKFYEFNACHCGIQSSDAFSRPKNAFALSRVLAETIGTHYVEVAMDT